MGAIKAAVMDAFFTFTWIFCVSTLGALTSIIESALPVQGVASSLLVTTTILFLLLLLFNSIGEALGGASFNPAGNAAMYAAGFGGDTLFSMALRFPAQAAGAAGGALAILELMPPQYKHMLGGPSLKVDVHTGAIAEGLLTFLITMSVLWILIKGPKNPILRAWLLAASTVTFVVAGAGYTGPSMNPANAFGWAYASNSHNTWEHFFVYWISPFIGSILAAGCFRLLFGQPASKVKKA